MSDESIISRELNARRAARCAAADLVHDARQFLASATRLAQAAHAWDPSGQREDAMILGAAETVGDLLTLAAVSSPGIRQLLIEAVAASAPEAVPATSTTEGA